MPKAIVIGERAFKSHEAAKRFVRDIRDAYEDGVRVSEVDAAVLADLLLLHSEALQKIGKGIAGFSVATESQYGGRNRHFVVHRVDGSSTDFSFKNCIEGPSHRNDRLGALREAIAPQTTRFKQLAFEKVPRVRCAMEGTWIEFADAHVDHATPRTFAALVAKWLQSESLDLDDVTITPPGDNQLVAELADASQRRSWTTFHEKHAALRMVSSRANLSAAKRKA